MSSTQDVRYSGVSIEGRGLTNKLWNAVAPHTCLNLPFARRQESGKGWLPVQACPPPVDLWILARLDRAIVPA